jgi:tRNA A-37 threonylcarbamoyl transferase component Bud32
MAVRTGVLSDRYADARLIGQGGMGEIYLARDRDLGRRVAIKLLAERFARDESLRARFTREALTAARLSTHPNVVTIFDVGEHNGRPFIVMEYLSGGTLAERAREGNVSREQAVRWLDQAAAALDSAHAEGIIHRDVKPANLLLNERDEVHVADFGVARVLDETTSGLTAAGTVMGTAGYLSPEQAQGQPATAESDLYSLAVVAYELLTGGRPFERGSATAEAAAHIHDPVPPASARGVGLPRAVDHVFEQALAKDPSERFRNARALVAALRAALREDETARTRVLPAAVPPPPPSRGAAPPPPPRRRGGALPFVLVGALLLAMLLGGAVAAALLTGDDGGSAGTEPERVTVTRQQTQTQQGTTVVETETVVTTTPGTATEDQGGGGGAGGEGGAVSVDEAVALTDQATGQLGEGNWEEALELANEALPALQGTYANDFRYEAYAEYNTGKALAELDRCDEALPHLERSEQLQSERGEITEAKQQCGG